MIPLVAVTIVPIMLLVVAISASILIEVWDWIVGKIEEKRG